ncbi:MAG: low specificity L-threonine aldolase [Eubacterium sp.]|nr:low specificity L-threonine aldolase [Eubacterium sp.]
MNNTKLSFSSDYMEGAHPKVLARLLETNMEKTSGYGFDTYSQSAKAKIRKAIDCPDADIFFLIGGTQTNATVIDAALLPYQGVMAAKTGHISVHEAGAIEAGGHKVFELPASCGKVKADDVLSFINSYNSDENKEHMVMPGMLYISQPTEYGTLYSLSELEALSKICRESNVLFYLDGARLAYALACPKNDASLKDIARLCDAFYIGGTKCGLLFGEAVVFPKKNLIPHFFTLIKQHGALLAKGRINGLQFDTLFTDDLYFEIGKNAIDKAEKIKKALKEKGYEFAIDSPTNQIFIILDKAGYDRLISLVEMGFWENLPNGQTVMRIATSWATTDEDVEKLINVL